MSSLDFDPQSIQPKQWKLAKDIAHFLGQHGGRTFLVGGCVRDALLGEVPTELDIEVFGIEFSALERLLGERFALDRVGKSFSVLKLKNMDIDISTPRTETKTGNGHKDFAISSQPFLSYAEACARRDFTVNAILYDLAADTIIDPHNGVQDLQLRCLRHVSAETFVEDALRVLRAAQFIARFCLTPAPQTLALCSSMTQEHLPPERIFEEWKKLILKGVDIKAGLQFIKDCGWLRFYPELAELCGCEQEPEWHPEGDVWEHTGYCMNAFAQGRRRFAGEDYENLVIGFAVLCHDMGKPQTSHLRDGRIRSPRHDIVGVPLAKRFLEAFVLNKKLVEDVLPLVRWHMIPYQLHAQSSSTAAIRRLAHRVKRIDRLCRVSLADHNGRGGAYSERVDNLDWLTEQAKALQIFNAVEPPVLMGRHLLEMGLSPGAHFKLALDDCYKAQLAGKFSTPEEAKIYLRKLLSAKYSKFLSAPLEEEAQA